MEVIRETLWNSWKRCLSTPTKPPSKKSKICLSETEYQHKGTRKKCKKTNQAAIIQWQRQCLMDKLHHNPWPRAKTSDFAKQSPSPLHDTYLLGRARFTAQPLSATSFPGSLSYPSRDPGWVWSRVSQNLGDYCLVPRPHYSARPKRFGSRGPIENVRPRQKS